MERTSISDLPDGTMARIEKRAIKAQKLKNNGKPNITAYLRDLITKDAQKAVIK